jgi:hypothetical protein
MDCSGGYSFHSKLDVCDSIDEDIVEIINNGGERVES